MPTQKPDNNLSTPLGNYSLEQLRATTYHFSLPALIENEFYAKNEKATRQGWKVGKLHEEWNEHWHTYQCLRIIAPRDHLKSFFWSEALALRWAKENPDGQIQIYRKTEKLGIQTLDRIKKWSKIPYFRDLRNKSVLDNKTQLRFGNGSEIFVGGYGTAGRGGHPQLIILDDVIDTDVIYSDEQNQKSKERFASEILPMAEPDTRIVMIGTVQREDDLYSIDLSSIEEEGADDGLFAHHWGSFTYDAVVSEEKQITLFPEKWSWQALMRKKREIVAISGLQWFLKEYRNQPVAKGGAIIKPEWIKYYKKGQEPKNLTIYSGWDLSTGKKIDEGDFTAKSTVGVTDLGDIYIKSMLNERLGFALRVRALIDHGLIDKPRNIRIEDNTFQNDTVQTAKRNSALPIEGTTTTKNKIQKFREEVAPLFENGKVWVCEDDPVQKKFVEQLLALPFGKYDDLVDAFNLSTKEIPYLSKASDYAVVV
jgi:predicted phage terminase large subunit-like protein